MMTTTGSVLEEECTAQVVRLVRAQVLLKPLPPQPAMQQQQDHHPSPPQTDRRSQKSRVAFAQSAQDAPRPLAPDTLHPPAAHAHASTSADTTTSSDKKTDAVQRVLYREGSSRHFNALLALSNIVVVPVVLGLYLKGRPYAAAGMVLHWCVSVLHHLAQCGHHLTGFAVLHPVRKLLNKLDTLSWLAAVLYFVWLATVQQPRLVYDWHVQQLAAVSALLAAASYYPPLGTRLYVVVHCLHHYFGHYCMNQLVERLVPLRH
jgi:hypothetical protein